MKTFFAIAMLILATGVSFAAPATTDRLVQIGITGAFVPGGFDSNSDAYV